MRKLIFIIPLLAFVLAFVGSQFLMAEPASACCDCPSPPYILGSYADCVAACGPDSCIPRCGSCCWVCF